MQSEWKQTVFPFILKNFFLVISLWLEQLGELREDNKKIMAQLGILMWQSVGLLIVKQVHWTLKYLPLKLGKLSLKFSEVQIST